VDRVFEIPYTHRATLSGKNVTVINNVTIQ